MENGRNILKTVGSLLKGSIIGKIISQMDCGPIITAKVILLQPKFIKMVSSTV